MGIRPASVTVYPNADSVFVTVARAFESAHPEKTGSRSDGAMAHPRWRKPPHKSWTRSRAAAVADALRRLTRELVAALRTRLPDVRATRDRTATLRYGEQTVTIKHDGATFVMRCAGLGLMMISQHDGLTASNDALSLAGHSDARLSKG